jgi:hypothetical protein
MVSSSLTITSAPGDFCVNKHEPLLGELDPFEIIGLECDAFESHPIDPRITQLEEFESG